MMTHPVPLFIFFLLLTHHTPGALSLPTSSLPPSLTSLSSSITSLTLPSGALPLSVPTLQSLLNTTLAFPTPLIPLFNLTLPSFNLSPLNVTNLDQPVLNLNINTSFPAILGSLALDSLWLSPAGHLGLALVCDQAQANVHQADHDVGASLALLGSQEADDDAQLARVLDVLASITSAFTQCLFTLHVQPGQLVQVELLDATFRNPVGILDMFSSLVPLPTADALPAFRVRHLSLVASTLPLKCIDLDLDFTVPSSTMSLAAAPLALDVQATFSPAHMRLGCNQTEQWGFTANFTGGEVELVSQPVFSRTTLSFDLLPTPAAELLARLDDLISPGAGSVVPAPLIDAIAGTELTVGVSGVVQLGNRTAVVRVDVPFASISLVDVYNVTVDLNLVGTNVTLLDSDGTVIFGDLPPIRLRFDWPALALQLPDLPPADLPSILWPDLSPALPNLPWLPSFGRLALFRLSLDGSLDWTCGVRFPSFSLPGLPGLQLDMFDAAFSIDASLQLNLSAALDMHLLSMDVNAPVVMQLNAPPGWHSLDLEPGYHILLPDPDVLLATFHASLPIDLPQMLITRLSMRFNATASPVHLHVSAESLPEYELQVGPLALSMLRFEGTMAFPSLDVLDWHVTALFSLGTSVHLPVLVSPAGLQLRHASLVQLPAVVAALTAPQLAAVLPAVDFNVTTLVVALNGTSFGSLSLSAMALPDFELAIPALPLPLHQLALNANWTIDAAPDLDLSGVLGTTRLSVSLADPLVQLSGHGFTLNTALAALGLQVPILPSVGELRTDVFRLGLNPGNWTLGSMHLAALGNLSLPLAPFPRFALPLLNMSLALDPPFDLGALSWPGQLTLPARPGFDVVFALTMPDDVTVQWALAHPLDFSGSLGALPGLLFELPFPFDLEAALVPFGVLLDTHVVLISADTTCYIVHSVLECPSLAAAFRIDIGGVIPTTFGHWSLDDELTVSFVLSGNASSLQVRTQLIHEPGAIAPLPLLIERLESGHWRLSYAGEAGFFLSLPVLEQALLGSGPSALTSLLEQIVPVSARNLLTRDLVFLLDEQLESPALEAELSVAEISFAAFPWLELHFPRIHLVAHPLDVLTVANVSADLLLHQLPMITLQLAFPVPLPALRGDFDLELPSLSLLLDGLTLWLPPLFSLSMIAPLFLCKTWLCWPSFRWTGLTLTFDSFVFTRLESLEFSGYFAGIGVLPLPLAIRHLHVRVDAQEIQLNGDLLLDADLFGFAVEVDTPAQRLHWRLWPFDPTQVTLAHFLQQLGPSLGIDDFSIDADHPLAALLHAEVGLVAFSSTVALTDVSVLSVSTVPQPVPLSLLGIHVTHLQVTVTYVIPSSSWTADVQGRLLLQEHEFDLLGSFTGLTGAWTLGTDLEAQVAFAALEAAVPSMGVLLDMFPIPSAPAFLFFDWEGVALSFNLDTKIALPPLLTTILAPFQLDLDLSRVRFGVVQLPAGLDLSVRLQLTDLIELFNEPAIRFRDVDAVVRPGVFGFEAATASIEYSIPGGSMLHEFDRVSVLYESPFWHLSAATSNDLPNIMGLDLVIKAGCTVSTSFIPGAAITGLALSDCALQFGQVREEVRVWTAITQDQWFLIAETSELSLRAVASAFRVAWPAALDVKVRDFVLQVAPVTDMIPFIGRGPERLREGFLARGVVEAIGLSFELDARMSLLPPRATIRMRMSGGAERILLDRVLSAVNDHVPTEFLSCAVPSIVGVSLEEVSLPNPSLPVINVDVRILGRVITLKAKLRFDESLDALVRSLLASLNLQFDVGDSCDSAEEPANWGTRLCGEACRLFQPPISCQVPRWFPETCDYVDKVFSWACGGIFKSVCRETRKVCRKVSAQWRTVSGLCPSSNPISDLCRDKFCPIVTETITRSFCAIEGVVKECTGSGKLLAPAAHKSCPESCVVHGSCVQGECTGCDPGFAPDGAGGCADVDECAQGTHNCGYVQECSQGYCSTRHASCSNLYGSFECRCPHGVGGDGVCCQSSCPGHPGVVTGMSIRRLNGVSLSEPIPAGSTVRFALDYSGTTRSSDYIQWKRGGSSLHVRRIYSEIGDVWEKVTVCNRAGCRHTVVRLTVIETPIQDARIVSPSVVAAGDEERISVLASGSIPSVSWSSRLLAGSGTARLEQADSNSALFEASAAGVWAIDVQVSNSVSALAASTNVSVIDAVAGISISAPQHVQRCEVFNVSMSVEAGTDVVWSVYVDDHAVDDVQVAGRVAYASVSARVLGVGSFVRVRAENQVSAMETSVLVHVNATVVDALVCDLQLLELHRSGCDVPALLHASLFLPSLHSQPFEARVRASSSELVALAAGAVAPSDLELLRWTEPALRTFFPGLQRPDAVSVPLVLAILARGNIPSGELVCPLDSTAARSVLWAEHLLSVDSSRPLSEMVRKSFDYLNSLPSNVSGLVSKNVCVSVASSTRTCPSSAAGLECSGRGRCSDGTCVCSPAARGSDCSLDACVFVVGVETTIPSIASALNVSVADLHARNDLRAVVPGSLLWAGKAPAHQRSHACLEEHVAPLLGTRWFAREFATVEDVFVSTVSLLPSECPLYGALRVVDDDCASGPQQRVDPCTGETVNSCLRPASDMDVSLPPHADVRSPLIAFVSRVSRAIDEIELRGAPTSRFAEYTVVIRGVLPADWLGAGSLVQAGSFLGRVSPWAPRRTHLRKLSLSVRNPSGESLNPLQFLRTCAVGCNPRWAGDVDVAECSATFRCFAHQRGLVPSPLARRRFHKYTIENVLSDPDNALSVDAQRVLLRWLGPDARILSIPRSPLEVALRIVRDSEEHGNVTFSQPWLTYSSGMAVVLQKLSSMQSGLPRLTLVSRLADSLARTSDVVESLLPLTDPLVMSLAVVEVGDGAVLDSPPKDVSALWRLGPRRAAALIKRRTVLPQSELPWPASAILRVDTLDAPRDVDRDLCAVDHDCTGHGFCSASGECVCDADYLGGDCAAAPACGSTACNRHGTCIDATCHCQDGFQGGDCALQAYCNRGRCARRWLADDQCQLSCNTMDCAYDNHVCDSADTPCPCPSSLFQDNVCTPVCNIGACGYDDACSSSKYCSEHCEWAQVGDGVCQPGCDVATCRFDDDDCEPPGWVPGTRRDRCPASCPVELRLNGECDAECDLAECLHDYGSCVRPASCPETCSTVLLGDGKCDVACADAACEFDGGDCDEVQLCAPGCFDAMIGNEQCDFECNTPVCGFDGGDCTEVVAVQCAPGCTDALLVNSRCDAPCNASECSFDNGKCLCAPGCRPEVLAVCRQDCDACPAACVEEPGCGIVCLAEESHAEGGCAPGCLDHFRGDRTCDGECFSAVCNWDFGDCGGCDVVQQSCHANARCQLSPMLANSTMLAPECVCRDGFRGNGSVCHDVAECTELDTPCGNHTVCQELPGSFSCHCVPGYEGDPHAGCVPENLCARASSNPCVGENIQCAMRGIDPECSCGSQFQLVEIENSMRACVHNLANTTTVEWDPANLTLSADCLPGFVGDGASFCEDVDECALYAPCDNTTTTCENMAGSYRCVCRDGYVGEVGDHSCVDKNECADAARNGTEVCDAPAWQCRNTVGSFACMRHFGFFENGTDVNECARDGACGGRMECENTHGSFRCHCPPGSTAECPEGLILGPNNRSCVADRAWCPAGDSVLAGSHDTWLCSSGAVPSAETPRSCEDVDQCLARPCSGDPRRVCVNEEGLPGFSCVCSDGYVEDEAGDCQESLCVDDFCGCVAPAFVPAGNCTAEACECREVDLCAELEAPCGGAELVMFRPASLTRWILADRSTRQGRLLDQDSVADIEAQPWPTSPARVNRSVCHRGNASYSCECQDGFELVDLECVSSVPCNTTLACTEPNSHCVAAEAGTFVCVCDDKYRLGEDGGCESIFDCTDEQRNPCSENAQCSTLPNNGGFHCTCLDGFEREVVNHTCVDVDECALGTVCTGFAQTCHNMLGDYACGCAAGFFASGLSTQHSVECLDVDECKLPGACPEHASCSNHDAGHSCTCHAGYTGLACDNVDECALGLDDCHGNATCADTNGAWECVCDGGFVGSGQVCVDEPSCGVYDDCGEYAHCFETYGGYGCACLSGFVDENPQHPGRNCSYRHQCVLADACGANEQCVELVPGHTCRCLVGFSRAANGSCLDVNECASLSHLCGAHSTCVNREPAYHCESGECTLLHAGWECRCDDGFVHSTELGCTPECFCCNDPCPQNATCSEWLGGFECSCDHGFEDDGQGACAFVDLCASLEPCGAHANCTTGLATYTCECPAGFDGDPYSGCTPCAPDACAYNEECVPSEAGDGFSCRCWPDMHLNEHGICECNAGLSWVATTRECRDLVDNCDPDPCGYGTGTCRQNNSAAGGYECECVLGYSGRNCDLCNSTQVCSGRGVCDAHSYGCAVCDQYWGDTLCTTQIDVCETGANLCWFNHAHSACVFEDLLSTGLPYSCECPEHYSGDGWWNGTACSPTRYCDEEPGPCLVWEMCSESVDTAGPATCSCWPGYSGAGCATCDTSVACSGVLGSTCGQLDPDNGTVLPGCECGVDVFEEAGWDSPSCCELADEAVVSSSVVALRGFSNEIMCFGGGKYCYLQLGYQRDSGQTMLYVERDGESHECPYEYLWWTDSLCGSGIWFVLPDFVDFEAGELFVVHLARSHSPYVPAEPESWSADPYCEAALGMDSAHPLPVSATFAIDGVKVLRENPNRMLVARHHVGEGMVVELWEVSAAGGWEKLQSSAPFGPNGTPDWCRLGAFAGPSEDYKYFMGSYSPDRGAGGNVYLLASDLTVTEVISAPEHNHFHGFGSAVSVSWPYVFVGSPGAFDPAQGAISVWEHGVGVTQEIRDGAYAGRFGYSVKYVKPDGNEFLFTTAAQEISVWATEAVGVIYVYKKVGGTWQRNSRHDYQAMGMSQNDNKFIHPGWDMWVTDDQQHVYVMSSVYVHVFSYFSGSASWGHTGVISPSVSGAGWSQGWPPDRITMSDSYMATVGASRFVVVFKRTGSGVQDWTEHMVKDFASVANVQIVQITGSNQLIVGFYYNPLTLTFDLDAS